MEPKTITLPPACFYIWLFAVAFRSKKTLRSGFLSSFVEFLYAVHEQKPTMSQLIRRWGGYPVFPIRVKYLISVEGVKHLLSVKFR